MPLSSRRLRLAPITIVPMLAVLLASVAAHAVPRFVEHTIDDDLNGAVHVHPADMDGDGDLDVVACGVDADEIRVYLNEGGQYVLNVQLANLDGVYSVTVADFDGNGEMDIAAALLIADQIRVFFNVLGDDPSDLLVEDNYNLAHTVEVVDMNEDGHPDLLTTGSAATPIRLYTNDGAGSFTMTPLIDQAYQAQAATPVDIDDDGDLDVVSNNFTNDRFTLFRNDGTGGFDPVLIGNGDGAHWATAADIDGDGLPDPLTTALYDDQLTWWEEVFAGFYTPHVIDDALDGAIYCEGADLDLDGDIDVVATAEEAGEIAWYENDDLSFTKHLLRDDFAYAGAVLPVDLDADGDLDLLAAAIQADEVVWWELESIVPPAPFEMLSPVDDDTVRRSDGAEFDWEESSDPDPGAELSYRLTLGLVDGSDTLWVHGDGFSGTSGTLDLSGAWQDVDPGEYGGIAYVEAISQGDTLRSSNEAEVVVVLDGMAVEETAGPAPGSFHLAPAFPNPFNASTTVTVTLPEPALLTVRLYDVTGRAVTTLTDDMRAAGVHTLTLDAAALASGSYLLRAEVPGERMMTQRVTLVK